MQVWTKTVGFSTDSKLELDSSGQGVVKNMGPHTAYLYYKDDTATISGIQGSEPWLVPLVVGEALPFYMPDANATESLCARSTVDSNSTTLKYWGV